MEVENKLKVYEVDDVEVKLGEKNPEIIIKNHWNRNNFVVIEINEKRYTVSAAELDAAIENATNTRRYG